ncbi:MAG: hypothetical protein F7C08_01280 [Desulfurococcales archaeon]|nr:hypothetical protein [Desulfurococcales archaeon]
MLTVKTYGGDYEPYQKTPNLYKSTGFKLYELINNYTGFEGQPPYL